MKNRQINPEIKKSEPPFFSGACIFLYLHLTYGLILMLLILLTVSFSLRFRYGQLSGMVEPIAGVLGAYAVTVAEPLLPYALAFAAGAMIYVVNDDIIPEAQIW